MQPAKPAKVTGEEEREEYSSDGSGRDTDSTQESTCASWDVARNS
jgi:hypothetical protein